MDELLKSLVAHFDIESIFVVQAATALVRFLLNLIAKDSYTDFYAPFVAVIMGQVIAYTEFGLGLNSFIYGLKLAGSAIMFSVIFGKMVEGWSWFTKGKEDPVLAAKVQKSSTDTQSKIDSMKKLLKIKKGE